MALALTLLPPYSSAVKSLMFPEIQAKLGYMLMTEVRIVSEAKLKVFDGFLQKLATDLSM